MSGNVQVPYDQVGDSSMSARVINKIAEKLNRDVFELETPLYEYVDTDALDALFSNASGQRVQVEFQYEDLLVTVESDGRIAVHDGGSEQERER